MAELELAQVGPGHARMVALAGLGLSAKQAAGISPRSLVAELARLALWAEWSSNQQPASTLRLTNVVVKLAQPILPMVEPIQQTKKTNVEETTRAVVRSVIEELARLGEFSRQPRGLWVPGPLRLVTLEEEYAGLLVGGCPTALLSESVRGKVNLQNLLRTTTHLTTGHGLPCQRWQDWANVPQQGLATWTLEQFERIELAEVEGIPEGDVYDPGRARRFSAQYYRWTPLATYQGSGLRLVRFRSRRGMVSYAWGKFSKKKLTGIAALDIAVIDRRRLMYGLDQQANNPTSVRTRTDATEIVLEVRSALPGNEERLLQALGQLKPSAVDSFYPRVWGIPLPHAQLVTRALKNLGITIMQAKA